MFFCVKTLVCCSSWKLGPIWTVQLKNFERKMFSRPWFSAHTDKFSLCRRSDECLGSKGVIHQDQQNASMNTIISRVGDDKICQTGKTHHIAVATTCFLIQGKKYIYIVGSLEVLLYKYCWPFVREVRYLS